MALPLTLQLPALLSLMLLFLLSLQAPNMAQNAHGMATNFKGKRVKNSYELGATTTLTATATGTGNGTASTTGIELGCATCHKKHTLKNTLENVRRKLKKTTSNIQQRESEKQRGKRMCKQGNVACSNTL